MSVANTQEFRCLSLCTGYAGIELGLKRVIPALRTITYVEIEAFACANLVGKMETGLLDVAPIWTDIKTFDARPFRNKIHIVIAGYPCQPFSSAGRRRGKKDPRYLWLDIERIVRTVQPAWCFFENVEGHLSKGFAEVYCDLQKMGYKVEAGLFTAAECGAPHKRKRLFILAHHADSRFEDVQIQQEGQSTFGICRCDVADSTNCGCERVRLSVRPRRQNKTAAELKRKGQELADTNDDGLSFGKLRPASCEKRTQSAATESFYLFNQWPARPGQRQYEWEEPRTLANTKQRRRRRQDENSYRLQPTIKTPRPNQRQTQSRLGRAADGTSCRVDRLRLLGNGVVPQQAEKAFRELIRLFE